MSLRKFSIRLKDYTVSQPRHYCVCNSSDSIVRLRPGRLRNRGLISDRDKHILSQRPDLSWDPPVSYPVGRRGPLCEVKQFVREANLSPSSSVKVKNAWSYTSTSHRYSWRGV
jgi:hypothetical protein